MNTYMSYLLLFICIQPKQNILILREKVNFGTYEDEKLILEK